jgi:hypothetical protein
MYCHQCANQLEHSFPKLNYILAIGRRRLLEVIFESTLVGKLQNDIEPVALSEASMKTNHVRRVCLKAFKRLDLAVIVLVGRNIVEVVGFEHECISKWIAPNLWLRTVRYVTFHGGVGTNRLNVTRA